MGEASQEEGWVVCRIFKKKNYHKTLDSPVSTSSMTGETRSQMFDSCNGGAALEQILEYMEEKEGKRSGRFLRQIDTGVKNGYHETSFMKLPSLESPSSTSCQNYYQPINPDHHMITENEGLAGYQMESSSSAALTNWAALDRLVASQLNGQTGFSTDPTMAYCPPTDHQLQFPTLRSSSSISSSNRSYHPTHQDYNSEIDLWSFAQSSSDQLCHVPNAPV
ncbi:hypothetical protein FH972_003742 [Carpinus fangiana]|uniref:NAC domain-containing protein n=1 Tax=Carpinus fangiana TaxID=176857 RepID=A0A5N6QJF4_9ROSI|nr:hypothetical protein FH972_003742 [Carpinus fangiana]